VRLAPDVQVFEVASMMDNQTYSQCTDSVVVRVGAWTCQRAKRRSEEEAIVCRSRKSSLSRRQVLRILRSRRQHDAWSQD
jgi:ribosomal protein L14